MFSACLLETKILCVCVDRWSQEGKFIASNFPKRKKKFWSNICGFCEFKRKEKKFMLHLQQSNSVCYSKKEKKIQRLSSWCRWWLCVCVCTVYTHQIHQWYLIWWSYLTNIITESERERKKWLQIVNCFSFLVIIYSIFFLFLWFHHNNQPPTIATTTKQPK